MASQCCWEAPSPPMRLAVNMPLKKSPSRSPRISPNPTQLEMSAPIPHFALGRVISLRLQKEKRFRGSCKCLHHNWQWVFFNRSKITSESLALVARVTKHCSYCPRQDPINREKYGWGKQARRNREVLGLHSSGKGLRKWIFSLLHFNCGMMSPARVPSIRIRSLWWFQRKSRRRMAGKSRVRSLSHKSASGESSKPVFVN